MPVVVNASATGLSLYARFDDAANRAVDLTAGATLKANRYEAADAAILATGLPAGLYYPRVFIGTAAGQAIGDQLFAEHSRPFRWNGTAEVDEIGSVAGAVGSVAGGVGGSVAGDVGGKVLGGGAGVIGAIGAWVLNGSGESIPNTTQIGELDTAVGNNTSAIAAIGNALALVASDVTAIGGGVADLIVDVSGLSTQITALPVPLDAAGTRAALGMVDDDLDAQLDAIAAGGGGGESMPRVNFPPDQGFIRKVPSNGPSNIVLPIWLPAGDVGEQIVAIDMSPLYGKSNLVKNVGVPTMTPGGSSITVAASGPHDWYAYVLLDGVATAGEERTVTVVIEMESGAFRTVTFRVIGNAA